MLTGGVLVADVVDVSRAALVAFLALTEGGDLARSDVAAWMLGPYADALAVGRPPQELGRPSLVLADADDELASAAARAGAQIRRVLIAFSHAHDGSIAEKLVARGVVEPIRDEQGATGYAPSDGGGASLTLRALGVVASELLTRPNRLAADLVVDGERVWLAEQPIVSGVALRSRRTEPWVPARDVRDSDPGWPAHPPTLEDLVAAADDPTPRG